MNIEGFAQISCEEVYSENIENLKNMETTNSTRTLSEIASEVRRDWKKVYFGAVPYLDAMSTLNSVNDSYGFDSGKSIVAYFLSNATGWRGDVAKRVKKELNGLLK